MWKAPGANQIQSQDLARRRRFHPPSVQNLKRETIISIHTNNLITQNVEARALKFKTSLSYIMRACLEN